MKRCGGTYRNGPGKAFARCDRCRCKSYDHYEGDRCSEPAKRGERNDERR